jgi:hypothetical protein
MKDVSGKKAKGKYGAVYRDLWLIQVMADPPRHIKVANVIAMHTNTNSGQAYMSRDTIMKLANVCKRTVDRAMNALERGGHLRRHTEYSASTGKRSMRCWPTLRWTDLSRTSVNLVHNLWTKVAQDSLTRDTLTDTPILTSSVSTDGVLEGSTGREERGDWRDSKGPSSIESPNLGVTPKGEAFVLAIRHFQKRGGDLVGQALKDGSPAPMVLDEVRAVIDNGGTVDELAHALWSLTAGLSKKA